MMSENSFVEYSNTEVENDNRSNIVWGGVLETEGSTCF